MDGVSTQPATGMTRSQQVQRAGAAVLAREVASILTSPGLFVENAQGARVTDVDGNEYIDLNMGFGLHLLGHNPDVAYQAIREAADLTQVALPTPWPAELARLLVAAAPCAERVVFSNTGTEATMYAIRAARAVTGRTKVALFTGSYHGTHDYVMIDRDPASSPDSPRVVPRGRGIPRETTEQVLLLPYASEAAFSLIRQHRHELALVMIEPVQSDNPRADIGPYLQELRAVCTECDVPLVMDEVMTGFRLAFGGGQELLGVIPDMATYGKILGGGMPIGAVAGSERLMSAFDIGGPHPIVSGGTFNGNPLSMRVGCAMLRHLQTHPQVYSYLAEQSDRLAAEVNGFLLEEGFRAQLLHVRSMFRMRFEQGAADERDARPAPGDAVAPLLYAHLYRNGIIVTGLHFFFLSTAHMPADVSAVVAAFKQSLLELREQGAL